MTIDSILYNTHKVYQKINESLNGNLIMLKKELGKIVKELETIMLILNTNQIINIFNRKFTIQFLTFKVKVKENLLLDLMV